VSGRFPGVVMLTSSENRVCEWMSVAACILCMLCILPSSASAQISEVSAGVAPVGKFPSNGGGTYVLGPVVTGSISGSVTPRFRLGAELVGSQFYRRTQAPLLCPSGIECLPAYVGKFSGLIDLSGAAQIDLDPGRRFFLAGGLGAYSLFLSRSQLGIGGSAGVGTIVPITSRVCAVFEAKWLELFGASEGPAKLFPITAGLRF